MDMQTEKETSLIEILLEIASKLDEINYRLEAIDQKFTNFSNQRKPKEMSSAARVEEWTNRLKRK